jgi:hypothetical protein
VEKLILLYSSENGSLGVDNFSEGVFDGHVEYGVVFDGVLARL